MGGAEVFAREIDGTVYRFEIGGLWGGGNTLTERELIATDENTVYTTWTGLGLVGPREGKYLEHYPALWSVVPARVFRERFVGVVDDCMVFDGDEELGVGCERMCRDLADRCPDVTECEEECAGRPRASVDCLHTLQGCYLGDCPTLEDLD